MGLAADRGNGVRQRPGCHDTGGTSRCSACSRHCTHKLSGAKVRSPAVGYRGRMVGGTPEARLPHSRWRELGRLEPDRLAWIALAGLLLVGAAFLYHETRGTTLTWDDWGWVLERRGGGVDTF